MRNGGVSAAREFLHLAQHGDHRESLALRSCGKFRVLVWLRGDDLPFPSVNSWNSREWAEQEAREAARDGLDDESLGRVPVDRLTRVEIVEQRRIS